MTHNGASAVATASNSGAVRAPESQPCKLHSAARRVDAEGYRHLSVQRHQSTYRHRGTRNCAPLPWSRPMEDRSGSRPAAHRDREAGVPSCKRRPALRPEEGATDPNQWRSAAPARSAYCLSNTSTLSVFSPAAVVILIFEVKVLPSLDTVRVVVPTSWPPLFKENSAVLSSTCLPERWS